MHHKHKYLGLAEGVCSLKTINNFDICIFQFLFHTLHLLFGGAVVSERVAGSRYIMAWHYAFSKFFALFP